jgi:MoxR-like ATPase
MYYSGDTGSEFRFSPGPIFANLVLADEINRAPAKVQAALLEAMEERQVTVSGTTHKLPPLFMVMATQNPIEQEGTYPLPEAQMDRFLMHVQINYPPVEDEVEIISLIRGEDKPKETSEVSEEDPSSSRLPQNVIFDARKEISAIHVSEEIDRYMADVVCATRTPEKYEDELASWIEVGSSPRASLSLDRCARVHAWLKGKDYVAPDDVQAVAHDVLRHRMILSYTARGSGIDANSVVDRIVELVAV